MSQLPRYESYKDSGVQWLGEIPSHWVRTNVKYYYDVQLGKMLQPEAKSVDDINIKYLKAQHVQWEKIDSENMPEMWCSSKELSKYMVSNGDLLICEGGEVGRCGILTNLEEPAIIQNALHRVRNTARADVRYLNYFIQHTAQSDWFSILCNKATIAHFTSEKLLALPTLIPPLGEQKIIADFLDKRLTQVDALIAKQETLLEKLAEQRVALISHAVTKGLNPDVEMKESGVEWLGKVPKSWDIANLRYFISCNSGDALESSRILRDADEFNNIPVIGGNGLLGFTENSNYKKECIAVGRVGALCGNVHFIDYESWINDNALLIKLISDKFNINYLVYLLRSRNLNELASKTAQPLLTGTQVKAEKVCIPLMSEQLEIVRYLDTNLETLDKLLETVNKTIQTLREYRSTLITQVVTGKIDVRNLKLN
ncbi:restriction endonuclease subunit S [Acinetobacter pittii]|uniref:restriction endonuclease subunit S n=1 Tax=Acinetobacter pittii TaxID=48296 RepID=UPI00355C69CC